MSDAEELLLFRWRLAETIAWCAPRADATNPRDCLRSRELQPPGTATEMVAHSPPELSTVFGKHTDDIAGRRAGVEQLCIARRELLRGQGRSPLAPGSDTAEGRLLVYGIDENVWDCTSESESEGFFDAEDTPPWDTWIDVQREAPWTCAGTAPRRPGDFLLAWVPSAMIPVAEAGIDVNPVDCIFWARDFRQRRLNSPLLYQIEEAGLLG
jgi:hypothetical protein